MAFSPDYVRHVLNENFEDAKALLLGPMVAIDYAHLVMLAQQGIVAPDAAARIRDALDELSLDELRAARYDGSCEDLFFYVERQSPRCGDEAPGACTPRAAATTST
jgi:argininosuccinate lyase